MLTDPMNHIGSIRSPAQEAREDEELVRLVVEGDKTALRAVWDRYVVSVRSTLQACMGRDHAIDDLTQEVFLSFYRFAFRLREPKALRPYLLGIATRLAFLELRTRSRRNRWHRVFHWCGKDSGEAICHPDVDERDALRVLTGMLQRMPDRERQAFILRYVQDLTPAEVALAMRIPKGTAKRAISVGRRLVVQNARKNPALTEYLRHCREVE